MKVGVDEALNSSHFFIGRKVACVDAPHDGSLPSVLADVGVPDCGVTVSREDLVVVC